MDPRQASDRASSRRWAQALLDRSDWAIIDTETTGVDAIAEIVQVAALGPDGIALINTLVQPRRWIPTEAIAIHGITNAMVASAPRFSEIRPRLLDVLQGRLLIAYNAAFDRRLVRQTALLHRVSDVPAAWECAMEQYSRFVGQWSNRHGSYRWVPLPRPEAPPGYQHRAIDDCRATLAVILRMARE